MVAKQVNLGLLEEARKAVEAAAGHYSAMLANCETVLSGANAVELTGGHGETGAYQKQLNEFVTTWSGVLKAFLDDERKFVTFLGEVNERMIQSAGLYRQNELKIADSFTQIGNRIDGPGQ